MDTAPILTLILPHTYEITIFVPEKTLQRWPENCYENLVHLFVQYNLPSKLFPHWRELHYQVKGVKEKKIRLSERYLFTMENTFCTSHFVFFIYLLTKLKETTFSIGLSLFGLVVNRKGLGKPKQALFIKKKRKKG